MTVTVLVPLMEPELAVIVVVPAASAVTKPLAETVAVVTPDDVQVAVLVRSWVLPSVYVPVASNCKVVPSAIEALAGVTAMDSRVGGFTVRVEEPLIAPEAALMTVLPTPAPLANPVLEIVATAVADELQFTDVVRFCVVPSL